MTQNELIQALVKLCEDGGDHEVSSEPATRAVAVTMVVGFQIPDTDNLHLLSFAMSHTAVGVEEWRQAVMEELVMLDDEPMEEIVLNESSSR